MNIHAPPTTCKPIIYLAGKIGKNDWRTQIFGSRFGAAPNDGEDAYGFDRALDETLTLDYGTFRYGGPFFVSCDHGCAHGPSSHGASAGGCLYETAHRGGRLERLESIYRVNCARIRRADYIFAYINETDCYGTLIELGYAAALDKPISIGLGHDLKIEAYLDLWMTRECAQHRCFRGTPLETFHKFLSASGIARLWADP
jgi:hypothetical protein